MQGILSQRGKVNAACDRAPSILVGHREVRGGRESSDERDRRSVIDSGCLCPHEQVSPSHHSHPVVAPEDEPLQARQPPLQPVLLLGHPPDELLLGRQGGAEVNVRTLGSLLLER